MPKFRLRAGQSFKHRYDRQIRCRRHEDAHQQMPRVGGRHDRIDHEFRQHTVVALAGQRETKRPFNLSAQHRRLVVRLVRAGNVPTCEIGKKQRPPSAATLNSAQRRLTYCLESNAKKSGTAAEQCSGDPRHKMGRTANHKTPPNEPAENIADDHSSVNEISQKARYPTPATAEFSPSARITACLNNGGTIEHAKHIAAHEAPRNAKLATTLRTRSRWIRSNGSQMDVRCHPGINYLRGSPLRLSNRQE
jgi:hypothetical protein